MKKSSLILIPVMFMVFLYGFRNYSKPVPHQINSENGLYNSAFDRLNSFSVGNGEFSLGVDLTGLQTFPEFYTEGIPLMTMSDWGTDREETILTDIIS